jgi:hypothetical protein
MAPIKFEEQLKEKLEQRSIQPSKDAWAQLSDRLDEVEDKQNNKGFWWLGIAATIVGVLIALTFVFKSNTTIIEPTIVDTIDEPVINTNPVETKEILMVGDAVVVEQKEETAKKQVTKTPLKSVIKEKQKLLITETTDEVVAETDTKSGLQEPNKASVESNPEILDFETQKVNEVVAKIQKLQTENKEVTSEEIEALLVAAQKEITMQKLYNEATKTVDADALLRSVEDDLEQSFRDKVFTAIKSGYESVRTAVAERNN